MQTKTPRGHGSTEDGADTENSDHIHRIGTDTGWSALCYGSCISCGKKIWKTMSRGSILRRFEEQCRSTMTSWMILTYSKERNTRIESSSTYYVCIVYEV
mmetsp:Transcript_16448/g.33707  ORF Transcript_16448/g.33707 Transcript_16448/m.33707 type:complete len:100 (+) Transcript_16448:679-978(+)